MGDVEGVEGGGGGGGEVEDGDGVAHYGGDYIRTKSYKVGWVIGAARMSVENGNENEGLW